MQKSLDFGTESVNVKFYRVISIPGRYAIKIKPIESMDNFLNKLR